MKGLLIVAVAVLAIGGGILLWMFHSATGTPKGATAGAPNMPPPKGAGTGYANTGYGSTAANNATGGQQGTSALQDGVLNAVGNAAATTGTTIGAVDTIVTSAAAAIGRAFDSIGKK